MSNIIMGPLDRIWNSFTEASSKSESDLIVYHHWYSFFSQKVIMTLYEKNIGFKSVIVDLTSNEQYKEEFLEMNPRGEVPVIVHKGQVIPDSTRILDYIERKFSGGVNLKRIVASNYKDTHGWSGVYFFVEWIAATVPLVQVSDDPFLVKTILYFRDLIEDLPIGFITKGALIHTDLCGSQKWPFVLPVRDWIKEADKNRADFLKRLADKYPKNKAVLLYKADIQEKRHAILQDKKEYIEILGRVSSALDEIEKQLATRNFDGWLCCETFTIADVHLAILLERLRSIGLDTAWLQGKRPNINNYYRQVKQRDSFKKSVPSFANHLKVIAKSSPYELLYASSSVGVFLTLIFVFSKFKI